MNNNLKADILLKSMISVITEAWKLMNVSKKILSLLDISVQRKYQSKFNWFEKNVKNSLEDCNLIISELTGEKYHPGIPATPINLDEFEENDNLIILQVIEPTILTSDGIIIKSGSVLLGRSII